MPDAATVRIQVEAALSRKAPSALTPPPRMAHPVVATGIPDVNGLLQGGLPVGAITEITGAECSGRTSFALSFVARITQSGKVCAWVDVSDALHPESAAANGVDLRCMLWVRCVQATPGKPWARIEQALRVTDLVLQAGGFSAIVLDLGSIAPEHALRVPLATWFRYRAAAERSQAIILLLTQHPCAKSSAELLLRLHTGEAMRDETTVFTGARFCVEIARRRFAEAQNNVISLRKPPQRASAATWCSRAVGVGGR